MRYSWLLRWMKKSSTVNHALVFSTPSSGNEVIIHTGDGLNHDLTNVTNVLWHA